ncbi:MAG: hypothetical protein DRH70_09790 [Candidatus Coatesbacteria bacterium]|nr:MAG: hypothetical protein DRH70_09790 [Candidatus Coatesbacteria bacterium]
MVLDRKTNIYVVQRSAEELRQRIEAHCRLLASQNGEGGERAPESKHNLHGALDYQNVEKLRRAIVEAISVLDATRKCFKSRQLEELRKRLTKALL